LDTLTNTDAQPDCLHSLERTLEESRKLRERLREAMRASSWESISEEEVETKPAK
jgi:hypothetical protein